MNDAKCGVCGEPRGSCRLGTRWPDGALCAWKPDIDPESAPVMYDALVLAEVALIDLGACMDSGCTEPNCNHAIFHIRKAKARARGETGDDSDA